MGWSRWGICALLFFATTPNYIDRQIIGILKPELSKQLGWSEIDYLPLVIVYLVADVGSAGGGWLSSSLIKRGWTVNAAREVTLLICALCVAPVFAASTTASLWAAVLLVGLAASAHQGFSANLHTLVSDTAPRQIVSSIVGIGGMAGAIGGMLYARLTGYILEWTHAYWPLFLIASCAYLVNLLIIHVLNPRLEPMQFDTLQVTKR